MPDEPPLQIAITLKKLSPELAPLLDGIRPLPAGVVHLPAPPATSETTMKWIRYAVFSAIVGVIGGILIVWEHRYVPSMHTVYSNHFFEFFKWFYVLLVFGMIGIYVFLTAAFANQRRLKEQTKYGSGRYGLFFTPNSLLLRSGQVFGMSDISVFPRSAIIKMEIKLPGEEGTVLQQTILYYRSTRGMESKCNDIVDFLPEKEARFEAARKIQDWMGLIEN